jgi:hypothetical protein
MSPHSTLPPSVLATVLTPKDPRPALTATWIQAATWVTAFFITTVIIPCSTLRTCHAAEKPHIYDVVIYGGTSAGIAAAVQAKRMGASVIVLEPTGRIGGLTTGGLGQTDIGKKAAIGGIAREFYQRIRKHYDDPANWKWQTPNSYQSGGQSRTTETEDTMWTFEPSAALQVMQRLAAEHDVTIILNAKLDRTLLAPQQKRTRGVIMNEQKIEAIVTESQDEYRGRCFIDATYEGDLLAGAGVSYTVGRESNATYDETLNGVQTQRAIHHQLRRGVDPYRTPGDPSSGLLPGIDATGPGTEGHGDHRVQAFCFRMCLTDRLPNQLKVQKPSDYDPQLYELLLRNLEAGASVLPWSFSLMPNRKTDINNNRGVSTDYIGESYLYPDGSYAERDEIVMRHLQYQKGLLWTLANHPRVPASMRNQVSKWAPCRDEFLNQDGWQKQLYIREARRMVGASVMTQKHCQGNLTAMQPIGLAAYTMDSHNVQRYVDSNGTVRNEGDVQVGGFSPYGIEYASLTPKASECTNLLVPVCLSASHIAFGSIRMEPVFMVLGQTAATAAVHAVQSDTSVQQVKYAKLREKLLADGQVLAWTYTKHPSPESVSAEKFSGIVLDDEVANRNGFDSISQSAGPFIEIGYRHDGNAGKGLQKATYKFTIEKPGRYELQLAWTQHKNRASNVPVTVILGNQKQQLVMNQREQPSSPPFGSMNTYDLKAGTVTIQITNAGTDGYVILDAARLVPLPLTSPRR